MSVVAVVGAQWGDEGKAKIVDVLAGDDSLIVQYAGGYDPGQAFVAQGERLVFHTVPANALRKGRTVLLAQGMALDPRLILEELELLEAHGALGGELLIDLRAQVVLPHHIELDRLRDEVEGASGAPRRGLGPAYQDRVARRGVRMGELLDAGSLAEEIGRSIEAARPLLESLGGEAPEIGPIAEAYAAAGEKLKARLVNGSRRIAAVAEAGDVVLEGPLGTMVDLDHGFYPYVVSASTVSGGACIGTGIAPRRIDRVVGVAKAYATRSGPGPLPSEVTGDLAATLQEKGGEISPITARPRRCGMFDVAVLRYAARVNAMNSVAITKLDVLTGLDEIPLCVGYEVDGAVQDEPPFEGFSRMQPLVEMCAGWSDPLGDCRTFEELPANARRYVEMIEETSGVPVEYVGVGPDRAQTIHRPR